ncbi:hypothetical protein ACFFGF_06835 [Asaia lannensis]|uniref:Uncharacterized protein n=1 Tax=Asaia lannensis NBRC 102526 TaxID=1307926 RepID=A0ABT1CIZ7_9PROT|nr:hypothetical protein [Asaia lannensis]MCO6160825.1 hypothetical protein [Asaia lannensis NBRC 102526]
MRILYHHILCRAFALIGSFSCLSPALGNPASGPVILGFDRDLIRHDSQTNVDYITVRDIYGIKNAMEAGDRSRLESLRAVVASAENVPALRKMMIALCDASIARVDGDFARSSNIILQALHQAGKLGDLSQTINPFVILLKSVHIGNLMLMGRVRDWADETEHMQSGFYAPLRAYYNKPNLEFRNMEFLRLSVPARTIPDASVEGPSSDSVELDPTESQFGDQTAISAKATVQIDGVPAAATFGTATIIGSIPFTLQRDHHWPIIGRMAGSKDISSTPRPQAVVLIPSIRIGQTVLTNQIMTVTHAETVLIGLQQLTRLRHLTITNRHISFGPAAPISCNQRPVVSSFRAGVSMFLLFPVSYERGDTQGILGIEDNSPDILTVNLASFEGRMAHRSHAEYLDTSYGPRAHETVSQNDTVDIGGKSLRSTVRYQIGDPTDLPVISMAALKTLDFSLDLPESMACLR